MTFDANLYPNTGTLVVNELLAVVADTDSTSTSTGALIVTGGMGISGNIFSGNVIGAGFYYANGIPVYSNIAAAAYFSTYTGNISAGNISATGNIVVTANIFSANVVTGNISSLGNITSANLSTGNIYALGNVTSANVIVGRIFATGNISAANVFFNNVSVVSNITTGNLISGNISVSGNIVAANLIITGTTNDPRAAVAKTDLLVYSMTFGV